MRWIGFTVALIVALVLLFLWRRVPDPPPATAAQLAAVPLERPARSEQGTVAVRREPPTSGRSADRKPRHVDSSTRATLRGRVFDAASGDPVRQFTIQFHVWWSRQPGDEDPGSRTFESRDGRFAWTDLPILSRGWHLSAHADGYQRLELPPFEVSAGETTKEIAIPLRRGARLQGRVFDESTGEGIGGATISFRESHIGPYEGNFRIRPGVTADENGAFRLEGVPIGRVTLQIYADEYASEERTIAVAPKASPLEIGLSAGGTISGRITAADGVTPAAGWVHMSSLDRGSGVGFRSDDNGEFAFRRLAPGHYEISAQMDGSIAESRRVDLAENERVEGLVFALGAGRSIRGVVTGLRAEELRELRIRVEREGAYLAAGMLLDVGVDEHGVFAFHGVQPGRVRLLADVGNRRHIQKSVTVPSDTDAVVDIAFPIGARLSGRVTRAGKPVPNITVWASSGNAKEPTGSAETSQSGEYVIDGLALGEYRVRAARANPRRIHIAGDSVLDFDLSAALISGRVLDASGMAPVSGAQVFFWSSGAKPGQLATLTTYADYSGAFDVSGLEPGEYVVSAFRPGYEMLRERFSLPLPDGEMILRLRADPGVEIRVHDASSGMRLSRILVAEQLGEQYGVHLRVQLDDNGFGYVPRALAGSRLRITADGYDPAVIERWSGQQLDVRLDRTQQ